jgi:hypothetical protein
MLNGPGSEASIMESEQDLAEQIAILIAAFCKEQAVSRGDDIGPLKRELWARIRKHWPEAKFTVINRALSIAYENLLANQHKAGVSVIDALRHDH